MKCGSDDKIHVRRLILTSKERVYDKRITPRLFPGKITLTYVDDPLLPVLFDIALARVIREMSGVTGDRKVNLGELNVLLAYADDTVITENIRDRVIQTTKKLLKSSETMRLTA